MYPKVNQNNRRTECSLGFYSTILDEEFAPDYPQYCWGLGQVFITKYGFILDSTDFPNVGIYITQPPDAKKRYAEISGWIGFLLLQIILVIVLTKCKFQRIKQ